MNWVKSNNASSDDGANWVSVSDLMAGLMIIFMFVAIVYMRNVTSIAQEWRATKQEIYQALEKTFRDEKMLWKVEIDPDLTIRFWEPETLFKAQSAELKPEFKRILASFFPRYLQVLHRFRGDIAEVRIEGHTSSEWIGVGKREAYFNNMELSQDRTRTVLEFGIKLPASRELEPWARKTVTANGMSSSRIILDKNTGKEDRHRSRRVEFRVVTNTDSRMHEILGKGEEQR